VYPLEDLPALDCVIVTSDVRLSTPEAFADWDKQNGISAEAAGKLTAQNCSDRLNGFRQAVFAWLSGFSSGVPAKGSGDRAEALLLDLVRAGIENDFETVVFPQHPELRVVKRALEREGAAFASLSGSGSTLYGLFRSADAAEKAASRLSVEGMPAVATKTLSRREYWKQIWA
jgi:4-diphosphocytidyl-2-C-methyl-D-erythritol kinase